MIKMHQYLSKLNFKTRGIGLEDITGEIKDVVSKSQVHTGMVNLTIMHTSASLIIQENASPDVQRDILIFLDRLIPMGKNLYEHRFEGIDDMPAHLKAMITNTTLTLSIVNAQLQLGTWQCIYLFEHRKSSQVRCVTVHCLGRKV